MPYAKTKDGSLVNEVTLGDGYPLSNDLQPLKVGGEASPIEMSTSLPDDSDNAKVKVRGDLEVTGGLNFKNDVEVDLSFDDLSLSGDLNVTGDVTVDTDTLKVDATNNRVGIGTTAPDSILDIRGTNPSIILAEMDHRFLSFNVDVPSDDVHTISVDQADALAFGEKLKADDTSLENEWVRITNAGKVGIGTESPTTTLDVEGTVSYKHTAFTTAGPTDNVDVSGTTVLECDTSGGHLTIGGFSGGVQGQILYVLKTTTDLNRVILEHNEGGGSQDIFLSSGADLSISLPSGIALYCNGSDWFALA